jgi:hypothetical protein
MSERVSQSSRESLRGGGSEEGVLGLDQKLKTLADIMREETEPKYFRPTESVIELGNKNYLVTLKARRAWKDPHDPRIVNFGNAVLIRRNICGSWVTRTHIYVTYLTDSPSYFKNKQLLAELPKDAIPVPLAKIFEWEVEI